MRVNDQSLLQPDGTRIAFGVTGRGPALMLTNGLTTTTTFWKYLRPIWAEKYTVVTWDFPGHGASGPAATSASATVPALPEMMAAILDRLGIERAVHVGWSVGSQVVLELYRQRPERARALVMLFGPAGRALENTRLPVPGAWIERMLAQPHADVLVGLLARALRLPVPPGLMSVLESAHIIGPQTSREDLLEILRDMSGLDAKTLPPLAVSTQRHSAFDVLPQVRVPLLIMTARRDPFMPMQNVAVPMHEAAPGSELVVLEAATHAALLDFPQEIARHVDDFIARRITT